MTEDIAYVMSTAGDVFETDSGVLYGLLGTELVTMTGGTYEIATQNTNIIIATGKFLDFGLTTGTVLTYKIYELTYHLVITSIQDLMNGYTRLYCTVGDLEDV